MFQDLFRISLPLFGHSRCKPGKCCRTDRKFTPSPSLNPVQPEKDSWTYPKSRGTVVRLAHCRAGDKFLIAESSARSQSHLKTGEFRHHIEWRDLPWQLLSDQFDASGRTVPEKMRCTIKIPNKAWVQSHQPRTREVCGDRV